MPFYTFIMEYKSGTYISQVEALSAKKASIEWAQKLDIEEIFDFNQSTKKRLIEEMDKTDFVLLKGLTNAWCNSVLLGRKTALINIVQTDKQTDNRQAAADN